MPVQYGSPRGLLVGYQISQPTLPVSKSARSTSRAIVPETT